MVAAVVSGAAVSRCLQCVGRCSTQGVLLRVSLIYIETGYFGCMAAGATAEGDSATADLRVQRRVSRRGDETAAVAGD